jgi:uncharacterized protein (TIGR03435 family)
MRHLARRMLGVTISIVRSAALLAAGAFAAVTSAAVAQTPRLQATANFAVVSIKPTQAEFMESGDTPDGFSANSITLRDLIVYAFDLKMPELVSRLPGWADSQRFAVEAKMDDATLAALHKLPQKEQDEQRSLMEQTMLADRFNLKFHHENRQMPVFALVVAKGGPRLKQSAPGAKMNMNYGRGFLTAAAATMVDLSDVLSDRDEAGRVVVDRTGLADKYDFTLRYAADTDEAESDSAASLFTAIEEQLGLKLEPVKAPIDTIVVDHAEQPTKN